MTDFSQFLILTDLDGTFFGRHGSVPPRNRAAVEHFCACGGLFTFATGRLHFNIRKILPDPEGVVNAPAVMSNGAYLYDFSHRLVLFEDLIPAELAVEMLDFVDRELPDAQFRVSAREELRTTSDRGFLRQDIAACDQGSVYIGPAQTWAVDDWLKIVFRGEEGELRCVREKLDARFTGRLQVTSSGKEIIEVLPSHVSKASGLSALRRLLGDTAPARRVIALGDFENDLSMLRAADIAIAPANAIPAVKEIADAVVCDCGEGVIGDVVDLLAAGKWGV